jgi:hypothetical protein
MIVFNNKSSPQKCQLHRVRAALFLFFHNTIYYKPIVIKERSSGTYKNGANFFIKYVTPHLSGLQVASLGKKVEDLSLNLN